MLRRIQEEDEDEESSSSKTSTEALEEFRAQWVREVHSTPSQLDEAPVKVDPEVEAKELFLKAVQLEQSGKMVEAIKNYRRALQLVPDIESKVYIVQSTQAAATAEHDSEEEEMTDETDVEGLIASFQQMDTNSMGFCEPLSEPRHVHISCLPAEVVDYIIRWVVSSELDIRSLGKLAQVCRGFYVFAGKPELWKRICMRLWGPNCGMPSWHGFSSWRDMYFKRPHLLFHGCYISKTTYIRQGENSFQDSEYQPWHIVEYFRLFRFFVDGTVLMMTTSDDLTSGVNVLRVKYAKNANVMKGYYKLIGTRVVARMHRISKVPITVPGSRGKRSKKEVFETKEQFNEIELELKPAKNRPNFQLSWVLYRVRMIYGNGHEAVSDYDIVPAKFPPLHFSRVKSYTQEADGPL